MPWRCRCRCSGRCRPQEPYRQPCSRSNGRPVRVDPGDPVCIVHRRAPGPFKPGAVPRRAGGQPDSSSPRQPSGFPATANSTPRRARESRTTGSGRCPVIQCDPAHRSRSPQPSSVPDSSVFFRGRAARVNVGAGAPVGAGSVAVRARLAAPRCPGGSGGGHAGPSVHSHRRAARSPASGSGVGAALPGGVVIRQARCDSKVMAARIIGSGSLWTMTTVSRVSWRRESCVDRRRALRVP